jgi:histidinol-phosphate aminotransferase
VISAITAAATDGLRLYPDPNSTALREAIAQYHGLSVDQVFVGNGSDEVLAFAFNGLLNHGKPIYFPDVTYSFYPVYCGLFGIPYRAVPVDEGFRVRVEDYAGDCGGVVIANPNAPTGIALELAQVDALLAMHPEKAVVIDEAYVDFGAESAVRLLKDRPNLLVVQTMSKSRGLAGLRVGYALGSRDLVQALSRIKDSFNSYPLDRLAQAGAAAAITAETHFRETCRRIVGDRDDLSAQLSALGFAVLPSKANFLFAAHQRMSAEVIATRLRELSILVRHFKAPRIENFLRISIGTASDNGKLVSALQAMMEI